MVTLTRRVLLASGVAVLIPEPRDQDQEATAEAGPSQSTSFSPVEIPDWVLDVTRMSYLAPDLVPDAARIGVQVVHGNAVWPYYPLRRDGGGLSDSDSALLRRFVEMTHQHGMKLVLGLPPFPSVAAMLAHPEWRIAADAESASRVIEPVENNLGTRLACNLGPWGDYLIELCAELMQDYGLDGYSFDGNYHPPLCHCLACQAAWRAETGRELPAATDLEQIAYREYLVWRGEKLEDHYRRLQQRLKSIDASAVVMTWTVNAGRYGHFLHSPRAMPTRLNLLIDAPMQEWWLDETNLGASIAPVFGAEYLAAVTGYRVCGCEPYLMSRGNPYSADSFPAHERMTRSLMTLAHGSTTAHSLGWTGGVEGAAPVFAETIRREPWITRAKPITWAAILVSEQTRQFFAWRDIAERFLPHVFGAYRVFLEEHLPVALINDWDITTEGLAPYRVLVLPNSAALSDSQADAVRKWVAAGGGLVATMESSLCDLLGRPRTDFALADVFGVSYRGALPSGAASESVALDENFARSLPEDYWARRSGAATLSWSPHPMTNQPALRDLVPGSTARFKGPQLLVTEPADAAEVVARIRPDGPGGVPADGLGSPAIIARSFGSGRVVYCAAGLDAAQYSYAYPYQRMLLRGAVDFVASQHPSIEVLAPRCVHVMFRERTDASGQRQLVLHLFNNINSTADYGRPSDDVPLREETVAIHGIRVRFRDGLPERLHVEPGGVALVATEAADGTHEVTLPPLELHAMLVGEGLRG